MSTHVRSWRQRRTTAIVWVMSVAIVVCCVGWSVLAQHVRKDACDYPVPPPRAQYFHCP